MKALVLRGEVVDMSENSFEVHKELTWVEAPEYVHIGWLYDGENFLPPPPQAPGTGGKGGSAVGGDINIGGRGGDGVIGGQGGNAISDDGINIAGDGGRGYGRATSQRSTETSLQDSVILEPNFFGIGLDIRKFFQACMDKINVFKR